MIIDIALFVQWIAPHLPWLMGKVADITVTKTTEGGIGKLGEAWNKLWGKVATKEAAKEAAEDLANNPDDADLQAALRVQLKKILEAPENAALAAEIAALLAEEKTRRQTIATNLQAETFKAGNLTQRGTADEQVAFEGSKIKHIEFNDLTQDMR